MNLTRRAVLGQFAGGGAGVWGLVGGSPTVTYGRAGNCIEVFRRGVKIQTVESARPAYLWADERRARLFVVNEIDEYQGLPAGTVESYAIARGGGWLELISRQALSLSAVRPRHFAVSPDGRFMVVAVYGGGAYNVLPIDSEGRIGRVSQVIKEIGRGVDARLQRASHPHSVVFHESGQFVAGTDFGCDRINVFAFEAARLRRIERIATPAGSGPGEVRWLGRELVVEHRLGMFSATYRLSSV